MRHKENRQKVKDVMVVIALDCLLVITIGFLVHLGMVHVPPVR